MSNFIRSATSAVDVASHRHVLTWSQAQLENSAQLRATASQYIQQSCYLFVLATLALIVGASDPAAAKSVRKQGEPAKIQRYVSSDDFALLPVYLWPIKRPAPSPAVCISSGSTTFRLDQINSFWRTAAIP